MRQYGDGVFVSGLRKEETFRSSFYTFELGTFRDFRFLKFKTGSSSWSIGNGGYGWSRLYVGA